MGPSVWPSQVTRGEFKNRGAGGGQRTAGGDGAELRPRRRNGSHSTESGLQPAPRCPPKPPFAHPYSGEGRKGPPRCSGLKHFAAPSPDTPWLPSCTTSPSSRKAAEPGDGVQPADSAGHQLARRAEREVRELPLLEFSLPNLTSAFSQTQFKWKPPLKFKPKPTA